MIFAKWKFPCKIIFILFFPILFSCGDDYSFQAFSYPPGSKPHENNWEYTALVIVSSGHKPIAEKSEKIVRIKVHDKNKQYLLNDTFEFVSASINAIVIWEKFEILKIKLVEVGNEFVGDRYNTELIRVGPNVLSEITYVFDNKTHNYKKTINTRSKK